MESFLYRGYTFAQEQTLKQEREKIRKYLSGESDVVPVMMYERCD